MGLRTLQGYGQTKLVHAAVDINFVLKAFKTVILLCNLEKNNSILVHQTQSNSLNRF